MSKIVTEIVVMLKNERHFHKKIEGNFRESMKGLFGAFYFSEKNNRVFHRFSKAAIVGLLGQSMVTPSESMPVSVSIFRACNLEAF